MLGGDLGGHVGQDASGEHDAGRRLLVPETPHAIPHVA
jgi:hypothetical protein